MSLNPTKAYPVILLKVRSVIQYLKKFSIAAVPLCVAAVNGRNTVVRKIAFNDVMYAYLCECEGVHLTS
jgi:hypothetical protein